MKTLYQVTLMVAGLALSTASFAQLSCPPRQCGYNGVSTDGVAKDKAETDKTKASVEEKKISHEESAKPSNNNVKKDTK